jgi:long-chain acyl-CoA synthetase
MHVGGKNVIIPEFDPKVVLQKIERERVSIIVSFPPILAKLLTEISEGTYDLSSLRHVLGLDHPDTIASFEKKTGSQFWQFYGQTEAMGLTSLCPHAEKPGSAGRQGLLVGIKLVDEHGREVETGERGEILVRGPLVFQGYWQQDELNRHTFRDGWHHTGDMGRLDNEGYLWYVGRKAEKELIKTGGENVYPVEVEKVILEHPCVKEVTVIGVPDSTFGEGIKAICVLKPNVRLAEQELIDFVAARVARYKKPRYVTFVESLPKKEDGGIDRESVIETHGESH